MVGRDMTTTGEDSSDGARPSAVIWRDTVNAPTGLRYDGAVNLREVAGLPTVDGRRVRSGVLFRSGTPQLMSPASARAMVEDLKIRLVVDLREDSEAAQEGDGGLSDAGVGILRAPVSAPSISDGRAVVRGGVAGGLVVRHYSSYLDGSRATIRTLTEALAEPGGTPALIHCAAGKDRTGTVVMLLLDAIGVQRSAIVADYIGGQDSGQAILDALKRIPSYAARIAAAPAEAHIAVAETAELLLREIDVRFGGGAGWLREAGVREEHLAVLRRRLTEPT